MLDGLAHGRPLVNGDSGFIPRAFDRAMELFEHGLSAEGLRFLRAVDVRDVVLPSADFAPAEGVCEAQRFESARVLEVRGGPRAEVVTPATPVPTRFTQHAITLELPEARRVGRIAFALDDRPWLPHPSVLATADGASWEPLDAVASLADATLSLYADPRRARGEIRFAPRPARAFRVDARLPARQAPLEVGE
jgi:hypothetical protein